MAKVESRGHRQSVFIDALRGLQSELVIPFDHNVKSIYTFLSVSLPSAAAHVAQPGPIAARLLLSC